MREGEITKRRIDREFPHQVAILIPVGGLVAWLIAMHKFCAPRTRCPTRHMLICAASRQLTMSGSALEIRAALMHSWSNSGRADPIKPQKPSGT